MIRKLKYRHKIAVSIFVFAFIPIVIFGSIMISKLWSDKVRDVLAKSNAQLASSANGIDSLLSASVDKLLFLNNNFYIYNYLSTSTDQNLIGIMSFSDYLQSVVKAMTAVNPDEGVAIYALKDTEYNGDYLRSIQNLEQAEGAGGGSLKDEILAYQKGDILWKFRTLQDRTGEPADYLFAYKTLMSLEKPLAIIETRLPVDQIMSFFPYDLPPGSFIVYDAGQKQTVIKASDPAMTRAPESAKGYYTLTRELKPGIGQIVMRIPKSLIFQELRWHFISIIAGFVILLGLLLFTVKTVSFFLTRKLEVLFRKMNKNVDQLISNDTLQLHTSDDEFGKMGDVFYEMTLKIKEYYQKITEYELEKTVLETQLLQERFNPHFLYNTLSTMRWISDDKRVQDVVDSMVKYYRIALNKGSSIITIKQEMEMIREYLRLQRFAYGKDFEFRVQIEDEIGEELVLKHLLQPVVENAALHGLSGMETGGMIQIRARREEADIVFEISDNGAGMEQAKIDQIMAGVQNNAYIGYGIKNIRKRIETFYGERYGFDIESSPGSGTTVSIRIPGLKSADPSSNRFLSSN